MPTDVAKWWEKPEKPNLQKFKTNRYIRQRRKSSHTLNTKTTALVQDKRITIIANNPVLTR